MKKQIMAVLVAVTILLGNTATAQARNADTKIIACDQMNISGDCIEVGVEGEYSAQVEEVLKRINEIRLEACRQGVPNPGQPSKVLTIEDYKPLQWSSDLEYVARIRAAEASIVPAHVRPNGESCFNVASPEHVFSNSEDLAWNFSGRMVDAVDQWYEEKKDWVDQKEGTVTGHYTSMINPQSTYVGMGTFYSSQGYFPGTSCARFSGGSGHDSTAMPVEKNVIQKMHILKNMLQNAKVICDYNISGTTGSNFAIGDKRQYSLRASTSYQRNGKSVILLGDQKWTSSDPSVLSVSEEGVVTAKKAGTAKITATAGGFTASATVSVLNMKKTKVTSIKAGKRKLTVRWKKISQNTSGYQIRYATNKKFTNKKTKLVKGYNKTKVTLTKLKAKKKYYVQVRTYHMIQGKKYYSEWSAVKSKKTK